MEICWSTSKWISIESIYQQEISPLVIIKKLTQPDVTQVLGSSFTFKALHRWSTHRVWFMVADLVDYSESSKHTSGKSPHQPVLQTERAWWPGHDIMSSAQSPRISRLVRSLVSASWTYAGRECMKNCRGTPGPNTPRAQRMQIMQLTRAGLWSPRWPTAWISFAHSQCDNKKDLNSFSPRFIYLCTDWNFSSRLATLLLKDQEPFKGIICFSLDWALDTKTWYHGWS